MYYIMRKSYYVMHKLLRYAKNVLRYAVIITLCGNYYVMWRHKRLSKEVVHRPMGRPVRRIFIIVWSYYVHMMGYWEQIVTKPYLVSKEAQLYSL